LERFIRPAAGLLWAGSGLHRNLPRGLRHPF